MDGEDLLLFERSLDKATAEQSGEALDAVLDGLGWHDALSLDPGAAIAALFPLQGAANATSSALGRVLAHALGLRSGVGTELVLPAMGRWDPPGSIDGADLVIHGLGPEPLSRERSVLVVTSRPGAPLPAPCRPDHCRCDTSTAWTRPWHWSR